MDTPANVVRYMQSKPRIWKNCLKSFATLARHHPFDRFAAIRLLANNVRDAERMSGEKLTFEERDKAAKFLLVNWQAGAYN